MIVSFSMGGGRKVDAQTQGTIPTNQVDSWVAIAADGTVTAYSGKCDFGQGFRTVQQQLVAEELTVPLNRIKMVICDTAFTPDQGVSSGSQGHPTQFGAGALRQALATAREALLQMASDQWRVPKGAWRAHRHIRNHGYHLRLAPTQELTIAVLEQAAEALQAHLM